MPRLKNEAIQNLSDGMQLAKKVFTKHELKDIGIFGWVAIILIGVLIYSLVGRLLANNKVHKKEVDE